MQLVLDTHGLTLKQRNRSFHVVGKKAQRVISPRQITSIAITAECLVSTAAIRLAVAHRIPIFLVDAAGHVEGRLWSAHFTGLASLRRAQANWVDDGCWIPWIYDNIRLKLERQAGLLANLGILDPSLAGILPARDQIAHLADGLNDHPEGTDGKQIRQKLLVAEAQAGRLYWQALSKAVPGTWKFKGRSRRPAQDPFNAALNYWYGMLYQVIESAVFAAGLDPYIGILHAEQYARPALVFDMIEPFRPWVDEMLVTACNQGTLEAHFFEVKDAGYWIAKAGKAWIIPAFNGFLEEKITLDKTMKSRKNHIYAYAGALAAQIRDAYPDLQGANPIQEEPLL